MTEAQDKRLEELRRKQLEEIHRKKQEDAHRRAVVQSERRIKSEKGKKRPGKSSKQIPTGDLLDEIDLSADLTADPNEDSSASSTLAEKAKRTRPILVVVVLIAISVLILNFFFSRGRDLPYYLDKIKPGMSYEEVMEIVPSAMVTKDRAALDAEHQVSEFTYLSEPDAQPTTFMHLGYRGFFPKSDNADIYFDEAGKVVGLQFSFERSEGWSPSWGTSRWNRREMGLPD